MTWLSSRNPRVCIVILWSESIINSTEFSPLLIPLISYGLLGHMDSNNSDSFFFSFIFISWRLITLQYCSGFYHTLTWISHGVTCIPHPDPPSHLPLHPIPLGLLGAPGPSTCLMHPTWAGDPNNSDSCTIAWICCRTFSCSEPHLKMADFSVTQYMGCTTIQRCKHFSRYP